jgi:hypothetical protein
MGMKILSETLSKTDMESKKISKELGITSTDKITVNSLSNTTYISTQTIKFMLEQNETKR